MNIEKSLKHFKNFFGNPMNFLKPGYTTFWDILIKFLVIKFLVLLTEVFSGTRNYLNDMRMNKLKKIYFTFYLREEVIFFIGFTGRTLLNIRSIACTFSVL